LHPFLTTSPLESSVRHAVPPIFSHHTAPPLGSTNPQQQVISAEVSGFIFANSRLSGVPDLALAFVDPHVIDDCSFHPCAFGVRGPAD